MGYPGHWAVQPFLRKEQGSAPAAPPLLSQEDFETVNAWEKLLYHPENGQFVLIHRAGSVQEEIFHLRLTVKAAVFSATAKAKIEAAGGQAEEG